MEPKHHTLIQALLLILGVLTLWRSDAEPVAVERTVEMQDHRGLDQHMAQEPSAPHQP